MSYTSTGSTYIHLLTVLLYIGTYGTLIMKDSYVYNHKKVSQRHNTTWVLESGESESLQNYSVDCGPFFDAILRHVLFHNICLIHK